MKKTLFPVLCLLVLLATLLGCGGVPDEKYSELLEHYTTIQEKQAQLVKEYADAKGSLEGKIALLEGELDAAKSNHRLLEGELDAAKSNHRLLEGELDAAKSDHRRVLEQNRKLQDELQQYRDTGITISSTGHLPRILKYEGYLFGPTSPISKRDWTDDDYVSLADNPDARDPTFAELITFLRADYTDTFLYAWFTQDSGGRLCGWFAERLHNNAEQAGIRAAYVSVSFDGSQVGHALNAFNTVDKGLVFIDVTGRKPNLSPPIFRPFTVTYIIGDTKSSDNVAYVKKGKPIGWVNIGLPYGLSYAEYERWQRDVAAMRLRFKSASDSQLSQIVRDSDSQLGTFFQPSDKMVSAIRIYW